MRRVILTLALAAGMVLGGASVALAHPNQPAAPNNPFDADNAVFKSGLGNAIGGTVLYTPPEGFGEPFEVNRGIAQGYFLHSPTCILHPPENPASH